MRERGAGRSHWPVCRLFRPPRPLGRSQETSSSVLVEPRLVSLVDRPTRLSVLPDGLDKVLPVDGQLAFLARHRSGCDLGHGQFQCLASFWGRSSELTRRSNGYSGLAFGLLQTASAREASGHSRPPTPPRTGHLAQASTLQRPPEWAQRMGKPAAAAPPNRHNRSQSACEQIFPRGRRSTGPQEPHDRFAVSLGTFSNASSTFKNTYYVFSGWRMSEVACDKVLDCS